MNNRIILFYVDWESTRGNHAGMAYFAKQLAINDSNIYIYKTSKIEHTHFNITSNNKIDKKISRILFLIKKNAIQYFHILLIYLFLNKNDKLVLMEYLTDTDYRYLHEDLARKLYRVKRCELLGLIHLPINYLKQTKRYNTDEKIAKQLSYIDRIIVFGSSLERDLRTIKKNSNIIRLLHYADTKYYAPNEKKSNENFTLICAGTIMRNYEDIFKIINSLPNVHFHFCVGKNNVDIRNFNHKNITLHGYLSEDDLKSLMLKCDASLNVFSDTVGSNVITTSLACGLPLIVSDVGSIRDYCDYTNAFFCKTVSDFIKCIESIESDKTLILKMSKSAREKSTEFNIENTYANFKNKLISM